MSNTKKIITGLLVLTGASEFHGFTRALFLACTVALLFGADRLNSWVEQKELELKAKDAEQEQD